LGKITERSEYKSEGDSSEVQGRDVGLTDCWLQLVCCAFLWSHQSNLLEAKTIVEAGVREESEGQSSEWGVNEIFKLLYQQLVRGYIQDSAIVYANMVMNNKSE
jgi:hypothetical protein